MKKQLLEKFSTIFGDSENVSVYFAPGRVNLIGEHTDYNGGHVFPCALSIGTYGAARKRTDRKLRFYSENFPADGIVETDLENLVPDKRAGWTNFPKGMIWTFLKEGYTINSGMDLFVYGNIPNSSGLSSSASLEVLTGFILKNLFRADCTNLQLAKMGQYSENHFNGVNCGIMDQFAVAMGKKGHAMFLDTNSLQYQYVPVQMDGMKLVVACSNKKRTLGESKYNERREQCEEARKELSKVVDIKTLGELNMEQFCAIQNVLKDEVLLKRARHAVSENQRTVEAVEALEKKDMELFGKLMNESHISLRDDYEVTGEELDTLVSEAWNVALVLGSRMTGAGFGGSTISLVREEGVEGFIHQVGEAYKRKIGYQADFYIVEIGDGPVVL